MAHGCLLGVLLASIPLARAADDGFSAFLAGFRAALAAEDAGAVAGLSRLPFLYESEWHERPAFEGVVPLLFDAKVRVCIAQAEPVAEDDAQVIFCDPYAFYFRRNEAGAWQFAEFGADGEALP